MNPNQKTEQWHKDREGKLTASAFGQAAGLGPGSRQQLWRRMMGLEEQFVGNTATDWGEQNEAAAIEEYRNRHLESGDAIDLVGFVPHPTMAWLGGSPDFLVGGAGYGEVKCPYSQTLYPEIPPYYMAQIQGGMQITGRTYCDFVVWTPDVMSVTRVDRSEEYWDWLHLRLADFWCWVVAQVEPPREKKSQPPKLKINAATLYKLKD
jgi:putative phage-type endonuclease